METEKSLPRRLHNKSELLSVILSIILNTTLLLVVKRNKSRKLESFGQIIALNCCMDYFLTLTTMIGGVQVDGQLGAMFLVADSHISHYVPLSWHLYINYLWCVGIGFSVLYQPIPFYHRYRAICRNEKLKFSKAVALIFAPMGMAFWNTSWMLAGIKKIESQHEEYAHLIMDPFWTNPDGKVPHFVVSDISDWPTLIFYLSCLVTFPAATITALYYYAQIHKQMKAKFETTTARTRALQKQLNWALLSQTFFPFLFGILPMSVYMLMLLLKTRNRIIPLFLTSLFSWVPVINPTLNLILVTPYRRTIASMLCLRYGPDAAISTVSGDKNFPSSKVNSIVQNN